MGCRLGFASAVAVLAAALAPVLPAAPVVGETAPAAAAAPEHAVVVTGEGVGTYPDFDPGVTRYGVTSTAATAGSITVSATTSDPAGVVSIDGRVAPGGTRTVEGLQPGDEVAVFIDDAAGRAVHSLVYLPPGFPTLERVTPAGAEPTFSHVLVTLGLYVRPSPYFETALDAEGVPAVVTTNPVLGNSSLDLKRQPDGHYSVFRGSGNPAFPDSELVVLDQQFREVARHRTVGLDHTDGHDSVLLPDGSRYLLAYEPAHDEATDRDVLDAVVQHVSAAGEVLFTWDSRGLLDETVTPGNPDYAHVNSIQVVDGGTNLLLSFRHLSAVLKIARTAHDGFAPGDVVWKLGGRASDFDFRTASGAADEGPCAQHTATQLEDGHVVVFDNGSATMFGAPLCVDPADPDGELRQRVPTRVVEWALDEEAHVATVVRDHRVGTRHSIFAGSAQPLAGGGEVVNWSPSVDALVSELDADGEVVWELRDSAPDGADRLFSYRAQALDLPDAIAPTVAVPVPAGATFLEGEQVDAGATCRDRGGSSLRTCDASPVDTTTPGDHLLTVTARDGAGNTTRVERRYRVLPLHQPDAAVRASGSSRLVGVGRLGTTPRQQLVLAAPAGRTVAGIVRVQNTGRRGDRFTVRPSWRAGRFVVRVVTPRRTSPWLPPGRTWPLSVRVTPRPTARRSDRVEVRLDVRSVQDRRRSDTVWLVVRR